MLNETLKTCFTSFILIVHFGVLAQSDSSTCYGTTAKGQLVSGVLLPVAGNNFVSYSKNTELQGRTYVHSAEYEILIKSYRDLADEMPDKKFKYGETGLQHGGLFKPHKTHQNGLSVDFMTPVIDEQHRSVYFDSNVGNQYGYAVEFDSEGRYKNMRIDYDAMAGHIVALDKNAKALGKSLWRVIFDPKLQPMLMKTRYADYLKQHIQFSTKPSWVRHDEHYHVDFRIDCLPLTDYQPI